VARPAIKPPSPVIPINAKRGEKVKIGSGNYGNSHYESKFRKDTEGTEKKENTEKKRGSMVKNSLYTPSMLKK
jgi:hypothetical protein